MSINRLFNRLSLKRVFHRLTIRSLLKVWIVSSFFVATVFTVTAIVSHESIVRKQEELIQRALPVNKVGQELNETVANLILRKANILTAANLAEYEQYTDRTELVNLFNAQLLALEQLLSHSDDDVLDSIRSAFKDYLEQDQRLTSTIHNILYMRMRLEDKIQLLEKLVREVRITAEAINGVIHLKKSQENKKLRTILNQFNSQRGEEIVQKFGESFIQALLFKDRKIHKASSQIREGVDNLILLLNKILQDSNKDELINLRNNDIVQQAALIKNALNLLDSHVSQYPQLHENVLKLKTLAGTMIDRLINGDESVYSLRIKILESEAVRESLRQEIHQAISRMQATLDQLEAVSMQITRQSVQSTRKVSMLALASILFVSFLVVVLSLLGALLLLIRIDNPLQKLRYAMSSLSQGELGTRINLKGMAKDEFADLARDFNHFSDTNQKTIERLSMIRAQLRESESRTRAILENALVGIVHLKNRRFISVNKKFEEMFGYGRDEIIGVSTAMLFTSHEDFQSVGEEAYARLDRGEEYHSEWLVKRKDGQDFWCAISARVIDRKNPGNGSIWLYEDISERKRNEEALKFLANYDTLTQLPNRSCFQTCLQENIDAARKMDAQLADVYRSR